MMDHFSKAGAFYSSFELKLLTPCLHNLEAPTLPALHNYMAHYMLCSCPLGGVIFIKCSGNSAP